MYQKLSICGFLLEFLFARLQALVGVLLIPVDEFAILDQPEGHDFEPHSGM
jgi:hypothetical protein